MAENIIALTDETFEAEVIKAEGAVLVDCWAEWCGPCRMLTPIIEEVASEYEGKAKVCKLDTDANQKTSAQFGVTAIPTIIIFKDGEIAEQMVGVQSKSALTDALDKAIG